MLRAFLDDSGTHNEATILLVGGLIGTDDHWSAFDAAWRERLDKPLDGKSRLKSFSSFDCYNSLDQFARYTRPESDLLTAEFRQIIKGSGLIGYGSGLDKQAWNELVTPTHRQFMGPPESFCVTHCVRNMLSDAKEHFVAEKEVTIIYDQGRRDIMRDRLMKFDWGRGITDAPKVTSFTYAKVSDHPGLQGADMIATEYYWWLKTSKLDINNSPRPHFQDYISSAIGIGDFWTRAQIESELSHRNPDGAPKPDYPPHLTGNIERA